MPCFRHVVKLLRYDRKAAVRHIYYNKTNYFPRSKTKVVIAYYADQSCHRKEDMMLMVMEMGSINLLQWRLGSPKF